MLTILTKAATRWMAERRHRAALRSLLDRNERLLVDIGLTRSDVEQTLGQPVTETANEHAYRASARTMTLEAIW